MRFIAKVPVEAIDGAEQGDVFTAEACAGMVGQRPMLSVGGDPTKPVARAQIVGAAPDADGLLLTFEVPDAYAPEVDRLLGPRPIGSAADMGIGYIVDDSIHVSPEGPRQVIGARVQTAFPAPKDPVVEAAKAPEPYDCPEHGPTMHTDACHYETHHRYPPSGCICGQAAKDPAVPVILGGE